MRIIAKFDPLRAWAAVCIAIAFLAFLIVISYSEYVEHHGFTFRHTLLLFALPIMAGGYKEMGFILTSLLFMKNVALYITDGGDVVYLSKYQRQILLKEIKTVEDVKDRRGFGLQKYTKIVDLSGRKKIYLPTFLFDKRSKNIEAALSECAD